MLDLEHTEQYRGLQGREVAVLDTLCNVVQFEPI